MILQVGSLTAAPGRKATGFLEVPDTTARMPLTLVNGVEEGPTLLITAGIHGGEYPSIEATIRLAAALDPGAVSGEIILMPLVCPEAFHARVQYVLPADGKNVNRQFPGNALGTVSERIAHIRWSARRPARRTPGSTCMAGTSTRRCFRSWAISKRASRVSRHAPARWPKSSGSST